MKDALVLTVEAALFKGYETLGMDDVGTFKNIINVANEIRENRSLWLHNCFCCSDEFSDYLRQVERFYNYHDCLAEEIRGYTFDLAKQVSRIYLNRYQIHIQLPIELGIIEIASRCCSDNPNCEICKY